MLEPVRSQYLAALGIDSYVPRLILPFAQPSLPCEWSVPASDAATAIDEVPVPDEVRAPAPAVNAAAPRSEQAVVMRERVESVQTAPRPMARTAAEPAPSRQAEASSLRFSLSVICADSGFLIIDDAPPAPSARTEYLEVLGKMLARLASPPQLLFDVFVWPRPRMPRHLDQGEAAAREVLATHLQKQIAARSLHTVLLFGDNAQQWAGGSFAQGDGAGLRRAQSISFWRCLREADAKRQLWNDVKQLAEQ